MEKRTLCNDHFVLGCKLCSGETPNAPPMPAPLPMPIIQPTIQAMPETQTLSAQPAPKVQTPVRSQEAQNVMTVADEYARACENYSEAQAAVAAMMVHISKMTEVLTNLQNSVITTRQEKDEAKRRVFDSMKEGV